MKKKVNINRPEISSEEIAQRKNFDSVLKNHANITGKPLFKKPWFLSSVIVATIAIIATAVLLNKQSTTNNQQPLTKTQEVLPVSDSLALLEFYKKEESKPCISPPLKEVNVPCTTFKVIAEKGANLDFKTGSKLVVPKNAFVDSNGKPVKGEVELRYREFHDPIDFFVSGIPMTYDSAGVKYQFESAGMMEMLAYQDGMPVNMAPSKSINVELASNYNGTEYNLYKLDTVKNNWACLGKDKVVSNNEPKGKNKPDTAKFFSVQQTPEYKTLETKKVEIQKEKEIKMASLPAPDSEPKRPELASKAKYIFVFKFELKEFPELAVYKNVEWKIGDENKNFNLATFNDINNTEWASTTIKEGPKKGENYLISVQLGKKKYTDLIVYPVLEGKSYEAAMKDYQDKFTKYNVVSEKRKVEEKKVEEVYQAKLIAIKKQQEALIAEEIRNANEQLKLISTEEKVVRMFTVNSFGIYNCDNPSKYPTGVKCTANLSNENKVKLMCYSIYLVDKAKNGLFTFYKNPVTKFSFDPDSKNILWTVENGVLYWLKPEQFNDIKDTDGLKNCIMNRVDQKFTTIEEMKAYFNF